MRFHVSALTAITSVSATSTRAEDPCHNICKATGTLCDAARGSWCNTTSGMCQNLFMTRDYDLCYSSAANRCDGGTAVRCTEAEEKLRQKLLFDEARRIGRETPEHQRPRLQLRIEMPRPEEFGSACVIC